VDDDLGGREERTMSEMQGSGGHHAESSVLSNSADGFTLEAAWKPEASEGRAGRLEFRILDPGGRAVRDFDEQHGKAMHLMVVRRDLTHYRHLHPSMGAGGTWSAPLSFPEPGVYSVLADFATAGHSLTLGEDLEIPGTYEPVSLPDPVGAERVGEYEIALASDAVAGGDASLVFEVSRDGQPVEDLEPYLGALGHLVALREGDLAFLHVHPETGVGAGPRIAFRVAFPSEGRYRLFLQFAHAGSVQTAAFTIAA
jgi:hypothetical protein